MELNPEPWYLALILHLTHLSFSTTHLALYLFLLRRCQSLCVLVMISNLDRAPDTVDSHPVGHELVKDTRFVLMFFTNSNRDWKRAAYTGNDSGRGQRIG
jgi:hypothetical protein